MGHDFIAPLMGHGEGGFQFFLKKERVGVAVPEGTHHAAGQVQLNVVHRILDLFTDGLDESVGAVAFPGMA